MANRTRPNQILFFVSDDEKRIIKGKMKQLGTNNMGAYLRKMAIDGLHHQKWTTRSRRNLPQQYLAQRQISTTFAAESTPQDTSMRTMLQS